MKPGTRVRFLGGRIGGAPELVAEDLGTVQKATRTRDEELTTKDMILVKFDRYVGRRRFADTWIKPECVKEIR